MPGLKERAKLLKLQRVVSLQNRIYDFKNVTNRKFFVETLRILQGEIPDIDLLNVLGTDEQTLQAIFEGTRYLTGKQCKRLNDFAKDLSRMLY